MGFLGRKSKKTKHEDKAATQIDMSDAENVIKENVMPDNVVLDDVKKEIEPDYINISETKEELPKEPTEEELIKEYTQKIQTMRSKRQTTKTKIKVIGVIDNKLYVEFSSDNTSKQEKDAIFSLLDSKLEINHSGRELISIQKQEDGNKEKDTDKE